MKIARTEEDLNRVLNWAMEGRNIDTRRPDLSYEDGIWDMFDWLMGHSDVPPDED